MKRIIFILVLILIIGAAVYAFIEGNNETAKDEAARITQSSDTGTIVNAIPQTKITNQFPDDDSPYRASKWVFADSDVYLCSVDYKHEERDRLQEFIDKGLIPAEGSDYCRGSGYDYFAYEYSKDKSKYVNPEIYTINRTMQLKSYDITERSYEYEEKELHKPIINQKTGKITKSVFDVRKYRDYLEVLTDGDTLVWVSSKSAVMDAKKLANDRYMVLTDTLVAYVGFENERRYAIVYDKLHLAKSWRARWGTDNKERIKYDPRKCGKILTENIYRIECPDGTIIHYKVKLTLQDMKNNLKIQKGDAPRIDASVIWLSVPLEKDVIGSYISHATSSDDISWDFNPDYSKEPVYTE